MRSPLVRLRLAAVAAPALLAASTAAAPPQASGGASWTPVPSDRRIAFRVVFPDGAPADPSARLVLEAASRDQESFLLGPFDATYRTVESTEVANGTVVRLALPVEAEWTRVRLDAASMSMRPVFLEDVEVERPAIVLRPQRAALVRVEVDPEDEEWDVALAGRRLWIDQEDPAERFKSWYRTRRRELVLDEGGRGRIRGVPMGATLSANRMGRRRLGNGSLDEASGGTWDPGLAVGLHGRSLVVTDAEDATWRLRPRRLATVVGRVVGPGGEEVASTRVFREATHDHARGTGDGGFELLVWHAPGDPWNVDITARARGFAARTLTVAAPADPDRTVDVGTIELAPHPPISGRLVLPGGRPAADFPLALGASYPKGGEEVRTDAGGRFRFERPAAASMILRGWARLEGDIAHRLGPLRVDAGASDLELTVRPATVFVGRAEFDDGTPVATVRVAAQLRVAPGVHPIPSAGGQLEATLPVTEGTFRWNGLPVGRWKVFVSAGGSKKTSQTLEHDSDRAPPLFRIPRSGAISGRVVTATGEPVAGARVVARDALGEATTAGTDASGAYRVEGLSAGAYTVRAWIRSARTARAEGVALEGGAEVEGIDLALPPGPELTLVVVDSETGDAVRDMSIDLAIDGEGLPHVFPNAQGVVRYGPLAPGVYRIRAREQNGSSGSRPSSRVRVHTSFLKIEPDTPDLERTIEVW
ncbi:MAG: carboxypeptidase-like regulatory domain-containing protein [Planctomycetota bacterium]